jgi:hypothetical protein
MTRVAWKMHISAEAVTIRWMIPSGTNSLPADEQSDYHKYTLSRKFANLEGMHFYEFF